MKRGHTGTGMALTAAAVLIPCTVWYWLGTHQLDREAKHLYEAASDEAYQRAERMASKLAVRLEELSEQENGRPYLEYWPEYLTRDDSCSTVKVRRSRLAGGNRNKLILVHFQIDEDGRIVSPDPNAELGAVDFSDPTAGRPSGPRNGRTEILASVVPSSSEAPPRLDHLATTTQFRWQTGAWKGRPALMAVRHVYAPDQSYVQGFALDTAGLVNWIYETGFPAILEPGEPRKAEAKVPILGAAWRVRVDPQPLRARAQERAGRMRRQFNQSFLTGALAALLAGACVVVVIRRSERLAEERSRFAAAAAHELRTPLAGIRLHGEMLALSLGNPARVSEYAQRITDEAERLSRLVSNVFSYTQLDQKRLRIRRTRGDLGDAVHEALALVRPLVEGAGADLIVRIADVLPPVEMDKDAIHQMVRNLVDNAEKYTRESSDRRIEVEVDPVDEGVALRVRDHGPGVPPGERARIFRPFARHEKHTAASGLGLGLAVVRTLAHAHDATIRYEDAVGGGACFVVTFPAA